MRVASPFCGRACLPPGLCRLVAYSCRYWNLSGRHNGVGYLLTYYDMLTLSQLVVDEGFPQPKGAGKGFGCGPIPPFVTTSS